MTDAPNSTGKDMLGEPLWIKVSGIFRDWVKSDVYGKGIGEKPFDGTPKFHAVWELVSGISGAIAEGRNLTDPTIPGRPQTFDLDMPIRQLLSCSLSGDVEHGRTLDGLVLVGLCVANLSALLSQASAHSPSSSGQDEFDDLVAKSGHRSWKDMKTAVLQPAAAMALGGALMRVFWEETGDRTLWSYFKTQPAENGYLSWWPGAATEFGRPLKPHLIPTHSGAVTVAVFSYAEDCDSTVKPYEWCAELRRNAGEAVPDAIAYGMVYVMEREFGELSSSDSDLRWASDAVSDTDVTQVLAFFRQHADAHDLMEEGDLCFVWLWERREGAAKGLGSECLLAALEDIKKRFRSVRTVIFSLRPAQFTNWGVRNEPPVVQVAKQEALEQLEYFVRKLSPQEKLKKGGELRFISQEQLGANEALAALGAADFFEGELGM